MNEQIIIPKIKKGIIVIFGIVVFRISKKYKKGTVNNMSKVIPIAKLSGLSRKNDDLAIKTISPIISNGIPNMIRFF